TIALETGMRLGEIMGMTWERVDLSRGVIRLELTKSGRRREVPMRQAVYDVLAKLPGERRGRVWPEQSIRTTWATAVESHRPEPPPARSTATPPGDVGPSPEEEMDERFKTPGTSTHRRRGHRRRGGGGPSHGGRRARGRLAARRHPSFADASSVGAGAGHAPTPAP